MSNDGQLSHLDEHGHIHMVDVGDKPISQRTARAEVMVRLAPAVLEQLAATGVVAKGNVVETARLAGIMAAKRTSDLIPLCHQIPLTQVAIAASLLDDGIRLESRVSCSHTTGVEMEALTAAGVAALTIYDMCKALDKGIVIDGLRLLEKTGGKNGTWSAKESS